MRLPPQMDPVQKAVLHHTLGLPTTAKRKHVSCSVCQLRFNSQVSTFPSDYEPRGQRSGGERGKQPVMCRSAENTHSLVFSNHPQEGLGVAGVSFKKNPLNSGKSLWLEFSVEVCHHQNNISCNNSQINLCINFHVSFRFYG